MRSRANKFMFAATLLCDRFAADSCSPSVYMLKRIDFSVSILLAIVFRTGTAISGKIRGWALESMVEAT